YFELSAERLMSASVIISRPPLGTGPLSRHDSGQPFGCPVKFRIDDNIIVGAEVGHFHFSTIQPSAPLLFVLCASPQYPPPEFVHGWRKNENEHSFREES